MRFLLLLLLLGTSAHAAPKTKAVTPTTPPLSAAPPELHITDATLPPAAIGQSAAASLVLFNPTSSTIIIRGATSPAAQLIRLQHIYQTPEGLMQMEQLPRLVVPSRGNIVLTPGATELRLLNLAQPLQAGYETPLTLIFDDGTTKTIRLQIKD